MGLFLLPYAVAQTMPDPLSGRLNQLDQLTGEISGFMSHRQLDSAWQFGVQPGLRLLSGVPDTALAVRQFQLQVGEYYRVRREHGAAIRVLQHVLRQNQRVGDSLSVNVARYRLASSYAFMGLYQPAITQTLLLLASEKRTQSPGLFRAYALLGTLYRGYGDTLRANQYFTEAIQCGRQATSRSIRSEALRLQAQQYALRRQYSRAITVTKRLLTTMPATGWCYEAPQTFVELAQYLYRMNRLPEARQQALRAIAEAHRCQADIAEVRGHRLLAEVCLAEGQVVPGLRAAQASLQVAHQKNLPSEQVEALTVLIRIQEASGHLTQALRTYRLLNTLSDSLHQVNKAEAVAQAQAGFDWEQKEIQIRLLHQNLALRRFQARQQEASLREAHQRQLWAAGLSALFFVGMAVTVWLLRRTQRQKAQIEKQRAELTQLNGVKDRLFAIIGHDLRGPVASLSRVLGRLQQPASPDETTDRLKKANQLIKSLSSLTDNLLYWSLSQQNGLHTHPQLVTLNAPIQEVLTLYKEAICQKNIQVVLPSTLTDPEGGCIRTDEAHLLIVLRNIIQNAIKFSPQGGVLEFATQSQADQLTLTISDEGPGFTPGIPAFPPSNKGTGLGLTVVEELMRQNGGQIGIESRRDHPGTIVQLTWAVGSAEKQLETYLKQTGN